MSGVGIDYDRAWEEVYGDLQDIGPTHRHMLRIMRRMLEPLEYSSVLEVGVGHGHNLPVLTRGRALRCVTGVDISERALTHVRERWDGTFRKLDIVSERLLETFELVCCALVMEHLDDDRAALGNLRAMTSRYLLLTTIGGNYDRYSPWERQVGHVRNYARGELQRKLCEAGFQIERAVYWGFPFYSPIARRLQNRMTATSHLPARARVIARILYLVFFLNSSRRGDLIVVLARPDHTR